MVFEAITLVKLVFLAIKFPSMVFQVLKLGFWEFQWVFQVFLLVILILAMEVIQFFHSAFLAKVILPSVFPL